MKKHLKLIIPAALLLITTSVYAQVNNDFEQEFNNFNSQAQQNFDGFFNQAQEEFNDFANKANDIEKQRQQQLEQANSSVNAENCPCPYNNFDCVCGDDKYCKTHAKIMQRNIPWNKIVEGLKDKTNHRQALYKSKWMITHPYGNPYVERIEASEIQQLSSFEEVKDYIMGVPLLDRSLETAAEKLAQYYQKTKEEKAFLKSLIKALENIETCTYDLDVENYGFDNFCTLSQAEGNLSISYAVGILSDIK